MKKITQPTSTTPSDVVIISSTTDDDINNMSRDNAISEYYRIMKPDTVSLTLDGVFNMEFNLITGCLKLARNKMASTIKFPLTQYHLTADTTDSTIERLHVAQCIFALTKYCEQKQIVPDSAYMRSLTKHQLLIEITKARDVLKGVKLPLPESTNATSNTNSTKTPTSKKQQRPRASKRELAQNLYGVDADKLDTHSTSDAKNDVRAPPKPLRDEDNNEDGHKAAESTREVYTIHAKIEVGSDKFHTPSLVRNLVIQIRKGDPLVQIVPVLHKDARPSEKLENEDALPDNEEKLKKWVENIRTDKSKLYFTMQMRTINIDNVKTVVYGWCKGKSHWVDFTTLSSTRVFNGGWFHNIHPFYYNQDHLQTTF